MYIKSITLIAATLAAIVTAAPLSPSGEINLQEGPEQSQVLVKRMFTPRGRSSHGRSHSRGTFSTSGGGGSGGGAASGGSGGGAASGGSGGGSLPPNPFGSGGGSGGYGPNNPYGGTLPGVDREGNLIPPNPNNVYGRGYRAAHENFGGVYEDNPSGGGSSSGGGRGGGSGSGGGAGRKLKKRSNDFAQPEEQQLLDSSEVYPEADSETFVRRSEDFDAEDSHADIPEQEDGDYDYDY